MSRTLRIEKKRNRRLLGSRKHLESLKQKYTKALRIDDWYIELPIRNNLRSKVTRS